MRSINRITAHALLALAAVSTAGCYSSSDGYRDDYYADEYGGYYDDGGRYYDDGGTVVRREYYDNDPYPYYRGGHHYRDRRHRDYHRQARQPVRVPRDADSVASGEGGLAYTPDQAGRVYVRDEKTGKVIYRGRVKPGEEVKVAADAKGRRVSVGGETARGDLSAKPRDREVFFRPDRGTAARAQRQERASQQAAEQKAARAERTAARESKRAASRSEGDGKKKD